MAEKELLLALPLTNAERQWLRNRLEVLSVKEEKQLAAAIFRTGNLQELAGKTGQELQTSILRMKPEAAVDAVNCLLSLHDYEVCYPANSYEELGEHYLRYETGLPMLAISFADLDRIGRQYEDRHPGLFVDGGFVVYPEKECPRLYTGSNLGVIEDRDWSVRLKLASAARPEGVWLRLPDYSIANDGKPDEVAMALHALRVETVQMCTLLDARCVLPEIQGLMEQYDDVASLIYDGNNLGFVLDGQDQGRPHFQERFAAAMEYENCRTLQAALEIAQDLDRYDFVLEHDLEAYGRAELMKHGCAEDAVLKGCIDLKAYGAAILEQAGYRSNATETAYIRRNGQAFQQDRPWERGMNMK